MLTKDLLAVTKRKPHIEPRNRAIDEYRSTAERVIVAYEPRQTRAEIDDAIADLETFADTHVVAVAAAREYARKHYDGVISKDKFVPKRALAELEAEIDG